MASACGLPGARCQPRPTTSPSCTSTAPTSGLGCVLPRPRSASVERLFHVLRVVHTKSPEACAPGRTTPKRRACFSHPDYDRRPRNLTWSAPCGVRGLYRRWGLSPRPEAAVDLRWDYTPHAAACATAREARLDVRPPEHAGAGDQPVGAGPTSSPAFTSVTPPSTSMATLSGRIRARAHDLGHRRRDEALAAEPGVDRHDQRHVAVMPRLGQGLDGRGRIECHAGQRSRLADLTRAHGAGARTPPDGRRSCRRRRRRTRRRSARDTRS